MRDDPAHARHPDLFCNAAACDYLCLSTACPTPQSAICALQRLARRAGVRPLALGKENVWHKTSLDRIVEVALAAAGRDRDGAGEGGAGE